MVVLTIREMNCLVVGLFDDLLGPAFVFILATLRFLPALFALIRSQHKKGHAFLLIHTTYCSTRLLSSFQAKTLPFDPVLQIDAIIV